MTTSEASIPIKEFILENGPVTYLRIKYKFKQQGQGEISINNCLKYLVKHEGITRIYIDNRIEYYFDSNWPLEINIGRKNDTP